ASRGRAPAARARWRRTQTRNSPSRSPPCARSSKLSAPTITACCCSGLAAAPPCASPPRQWTRPRALPTGASGGSPRACATGWRLTMTHELQPDPYEPDASREAHAPLSAAAEARKRELLPVLQRQLGRRRARREAIRGGV